jgi:hypothetical protein
MWITSFSRDFLHFASFTTHPDSHFQTHFNGPGTEFHDDRKQLSQTRPQDHQSQSLWGVSSPPRRCTTDHMADCSCVPQQRCAEIPPCPTRLEKTKDGQNRGVPRSFFLLVATMIPLPAFPTFRPFPLFRRNFIHLPFSPLRFSHIL